MVVDKLAEMAPHKSTLLLKNRIEVDAVRAHAVGPRILDLGIGSGSLPFVFADQDIETHTTALDPLPFPDGRFDSLVSLHTLAQAPHWQPILPEWARVVRKGGRLIFNLDWLERRVAAEDLVAEAERHGLSVVRLIPYGAFFVGEERGALSGGLPDKAFFKRLLSWMDTDPLLLELALLLEQEIVSQLAPLLTVRCMAIFEKRVDKKRNRAWQERNRALHACLRQVPIDLASLDALLDKPLRALRHPITELLATSLRCRRLFHCLAAPLVGSGRLRWSELVEPPLDSYFAEIAQKRADDRLATEWAQHAPHDVSGVAQVLQYEGVSLASGLEYWLVEPWLTQGIGRFTGVRS